MNNSYSELVSKSLDICDFGYSGLLKNMEIIPSTNSSYKIPNRYFIDSLILMPINPQNSYIYWEVTDETLERFGILPQSPKLQVSVFDENNNEVFSFESIFSVGDYYISHIQNYKFLTVRLYLKLQNNNVVLLLSSNTIKLCTPTLKTHMDLPLYCRYDLDSQYGLSSRSVATKEIR